MKNILTLPGNEGQKVYKQKNFSLPRLEYERKIVKR